MIKKPKMSDEIDSQPLTGNGASSQSSQPCEFNKNDEAYNMTNKRRTAVIFNQYEFEMNAHMTGKLTTRVGTKKDASDLRTVLESLNFEVTVYEDLKVNEIRNEISLLRNRDFKDQGCLAIFALTHGQYGNNLAAYNGWYKSKELWSSFTGANCPSLVGKPKLIFINACRGDQIDRGVACVSGDIDGEVRPKDPHFHIPEMADMLIALSTFEDYVSLRNPADGSWFIQSLCKHLADEEIGRKELKEILTITSREVACRRTFDGITQVPTIVSTLLRNLHLRDSNTD